MTEKTINLPGVGDLSVPALDQIRGRRLGLRLTPGERRVLLGVMDLMLLNAALVVVTALWDVLPISAGAPRAAAGILLAYRKWFITLSALWLVMATVLDVYDLARAASTSHSVTNTGIAALLTGLLYLSIPWLTPPLQSRSLLFVFVLLATLLVVGWRLVYAQVFVQPRFHQRALIVGPGAADHRLVQELQAATVDPAANPFRGTGYQILGFIDGDDSHPTGDGLPHLGTYAQLVRLARVLEIDEVIVAVNDEVPIEPGLQEILLDCRELGLRVSQLSTVYERLTARLPVEYASRDLNLILGPAQGASDRLYAAGKRLMDVVIALAGLMVVGLLAPFIGLVNAVTAPGPLFYRQQRVGEGGRPFRMLKFRSMVVGAEADDGAVWAGDRDPRVTPLGRWFRRTRLDELPQCWNVLCGEMSVVGPRPERPQFVGVLSRSIPLYRTRHAVKPGITGWTQIHFEYGNSEEDARKKLEYDLYYIKHAGLMVDLLILLQTLPVMLQLKGQ